LAIIQKSWVVLNPYSKKYVSTRLKLKVRAQIHYMLIHVSKWKDTKTIPPVPWPVTILESQWRSGGLFRIWPFRIQNYSQCKLLSGKCLFVMQSNKLFCDMWEITGGNGTPALVSCGVWFKSRELSDSSHINAQFIEFHRFRKFP
jgi:hypothetical protein